MLKRIDALLERYRSLASGAPLTSDAFARRFTFNSNAIEGNTLTEAETAWIIDNENGVVTGKPLVYSFDITGHYRTFDYIVKQAAAGIPITEQIVLEIHRDVLLSRPADAGRYREVEVYLRGVDLELPKPKYVPSLMQQLIEDNEKMQHEHPIVRAAVFHARFEGIHPFVDGNGRSGRLLLNYELLRCGYPPIDITVAERGKYFTCLHAYESSGTDIQPMIEFIAEHVLKEILLLLGD